MLKLLARCAVISVVLISASAAEPVKLKLAFPSSDRSTSYLAAVRPFVDAVNTEARGLIEIETYFSGVLGKDPAEQPQLVLDGTADIAYVVTGLTRNRFADNAIIEMPGLFTSMRESVPVFTRLVAANALLQEERDFGGIFTFQAGWAWRNSVGRLFRVGFQYLDGTSPQFQFFDVHEQQFGVGLWYDY